MASISSAEAFLFFGAVVVGLVSGIAGNWVVTTYFRWIEDRTRDNFLLFIGGVVVAGVIFSYAFYCFIITRSLP